MSIQPSKKEERIPFEPEKYNRLLGTDIAPEDNVGLLQND